MGAVRGRHHIGRRGRSLLFFAGLDLIYAVSLARPDPTSRDGALLTFLSSLAPLWAWALLWGVTGLICLWHAFRRCDRWGFVAAITLKVLWGGTCLGGWLIGGVERGYVSGAIWLAAAGFVWVISGWPEPGDGRGPTWIRPSS
jgi:hypothetical protein